MTDSAINIKKSKIIKNILHSLTANFISLLVSVVIVFILPRLIGIDEYGYFQLYLLYFSLGGFLQFGWSDGLYLKYGGHDYSLINKRLLGSQVKYLTVFYIIIASAVSLVIFKTNAPFDSRIIIFALISTLFTTPRGMIFYIWQATNRIKLFSNILILDRLLFLLFTIFILLGTNFNFEFIIIADIVAKGCSLLVAIIISSDLVLSKTVNFKNAMIEAKEEISIGYKLMLANISGSLILGIIKIMIETNWGITTFSQVSLTVSLSNFFLIFITALSIVIFPLLKNMNPENLRKTYKFIWILLSYSIMILLLMYFPFKFLILKWLPQYATGISFMSILFPIILYSTKTSVLGTTYLKSLRRENDLLKVNIAVLIIALILSYFTALILQNLFFTIVLIPIMFFLRYLFLEIVILKVIKMRLLFHTISELVLVISFILIGLYMNLLSGFLIFAFILACYYVANFKNLVFVFNIIINRKDVLK